VRLVLDWDGTITEVDSLHMVLLEFGDPEIYRETEERLGRRLTLHEVIATEFLTVTAPLEEVRRWLVEHVRVRPGLAELVAAHRPVVLSAGFHELIEPVLEREGAAGLEVLANRLEPRADGWRVRFRDEAVCAICGEPCKRSALGEAAFAYAGDGYSDRCVARAAARVFARDGLAAYLAAEGVPYERFEDLHDVVSALAA
jgi:2-hydroxy-3-keto-5-methylthiopentenyl-1-phosphate phosphatase